MKAIGNIFLGLWCGVASFISPVWIGMIMLNITGLIYKYDYTMDEGTAGIIGVTLAILWILFGLIPNIYLARKVYFIKKKHLIVYLVCMAVLCVWGFAACGWDVMRFLTA